MMSACGYLSSVVRKAAIRRLPIQQFGPLHRHQTSRAEVNLPRFPIRALPVCQPQTQWTDRKRLNAPLEEEEVKGETDQATDDEE